jgi:hypothetical protein
LHSMKVHLEYGQTSKITTSLGKRNYSGQQSLVKLGSTGSGLLNTYGFTAWYIWSETDKHHKITTTLGKRNFMGKKLL